MKMLFFASLFVFGTSSFAREEVTKEEFKQAVKDHKEYLEKVTPGMAKQIMAKVTWEVASDDEGEDEDKLASCMKEIDKTVTFLTKVGTQYYAQKKVATTLGTDSDSENCALETTENMTYLVLNKLMLHKNRHHNGGDLTLDLDTIGILSDEGDYVAMFYKVEDSVYDVEIMSESKGIKISYTLNLMKSIFLNPSKLSYSKGEKYTLTSEIAREFDIEVESINLSSISLCFSIPVPSEMKLDKHGRLVCTPESDFSFVLGQ